MFNHLNAKLNPICHLLALLGAHHILDVSRIRVNTGTGVSPVGFIPSVLHTHLHLSTVKSCYYTCSINPYLL
jgi:hypothetical protein